MKQLNARQGMSERESGVELGPGGVTTCLELLGTHLLLKKKILFCVRFPRSRTMRLLLVSLVSMHEQTIKKHTLLKI